MLNSRDHQPTVTEAVTALTDLMPMFESNGVTLGLETYEQVSTADLLTVVESVASQHDPRPQCQRLWGFRSPRPSRN
ncbi:hypothetical protein ACFVKB_29635 [Rhodococcus sp. NPDC127530]|uniref:hypothetical protein n=1 Tax=unclassified Rhodococcus (in: high G+C Gram-positive bacteria) TaxID=192944 RepID=UPI003627A3EC